MRNLGKNFKLKERGRNLTSTFNDSKMKTAKFLAISFVLFSGALHAASPAPMNSQVLPLAPPASLLKVQGPSLPQGYPVPLPIAEMIKRGKNVSVFDSFEVEGSDLTGWIMLSGSERRIYYVPKNGKFALLGLLFDAELNNTTATHALRLPDKLVNEKSAISPSSTVAAPNLQAPLMAGFESDQLSQFTLGQLATADTTHVEGFGRDVFIIYDPACIHCHKFWRDTRGLLNKIRIHWVPIAKVSATSSFIAQSIFSSSNRAAALEAAANQKLSPAAAVTHQVDVMLKKNALILDASGKKNVPYIVFAAGGKAYSYLGAPNPAALSLIVGGDGTSGALNGKQTNR
jgi:hypothetical protein